MKIVPDLLQDFINISHYAGERFDLTQASGGNSSVKTDEIMLIKTSGVYLSDVTTISGYAQIDLGPLRKYWQSKAIDSRIAFQQSLMAGKTPSMETWMHMLLGRVVLHTHPFTVNALTCHKEWRSEISSLFPQALLVPYHTPGIELAIGLDEVIKDANSDIHKPLVIFLQNHGLVISAEDVSTVVKFTESVTTRIEEYLGLDYEQYKLTTKIRNYVNSIAKNDFCYLCCDFEINNILQKDKDWFFITACIPHAYIFNTIPLEIANLQNSDQLNLYHQKYKRPPQIVIYNNRIYILAANITQAREIEIVLKTQLLLCKALGSKMRSLSLTETAAIDEAIKS